MAVTIKHKNLTLTKLISEVFSNPVVGSIVNKANDLEAANYELRTTPTTFSICKNSVTYSKVNLKLETVKLARQGKLGLLALVSIRDSLINLVGVAHAHHTATVILKEPFEAALTVEHISVATNKINKIKNVPVLLKKATELHQPVKGTSSGSIYHVIALSDDMVVAVRIKKDFTVAIRVECHKANDSKSGQKARASLKIAGLTKAKKGHYSLHLEPETLDMAVRSIGSTLFSINSFSQMSGDLKSLVGVGK